MTSYGLTIFSDGVGPERFRRAAETACAAEDAGFETVWTSELYNRSATISMASLAIATTRCRIGSSIAYGVGRTPVVWVAEARDLDGLSGGRLVLGIGNGNARMMEDWHGVSGEAPARRMEELVVLLRKLWRLDQGPVHHEGRFYRAHLSPTADTSPPLSEHLPLYIAGINPRMVEVAGRVADGLIGHPMFTARYVEEVIRPALAAGGETSGRAPESIGLVGILMCAVNDDLEQARRQMAFSIAQYAASRIYDRLFELHGWSEQQAQIRAAARAHDTEALIAAVPDEAIDLIGVACRPGELGDAVARHAADYDHLNLTGCAWGLDAEAQARAQLDIIDGMRASLVAPSGASG